MPEPIHSSENVLSSHESLRKRLRVKHYFRNIYKKVIGYDLIKIFLPSFFGKSSLNIIWVTDMNGLKAYFCSLESLLTL